MSPFWLEEAIVSVLFLVSLLVWLDLKRKQRAAKRRHPAKGTLTLAEQEDWLLLLEQLAPDETTNAEGWR